MSRYITQKGTIAVRPEWQENTVVKDQIRDMMIASARYQLAIKEEDVQIADPSQSVRKRKRLTDLSFEEKLRRKKLKNREAAQNSRDKKKAYVTSLESTVNSLIEQHDQLKAEMTKLFEDNKRLQAENARLESLLAEGVDRNTLERPAAPARPLQKDLCPATPPPSSHRLLTYLFLMSLIGWSTPSKPQISRSLRSLQTLYLKQPSNFRMSSPVRQRLDPWWGPRQKSWNPMPLPAKMILLKKMLSSSQFQRTMSSSKMP